MPSTHADHEHRAPSPAPTADHGTIRRHNLSSVLSCLRSTGPRSRARLADATGLNKATVSSLVTELIGRGLVAEGHAERGSVGRPGLNVELDGRSVWGIGAEVDATSVAVLATDLRGSVVDERRVAVDATAASGPTLEALARLLEATLADVAAAAALPAGVCVAAPGLVEWSSGTVSSATNLGWRSVPVVEELTRLLGEPPFPVLLDNTANLAAVAEVAALATGDGRAIDLALVTGGAAGVGGGLITEGRVLRGGRGLAGEVGHICVEPQGRACSCGRRGCWETVVGLGAFLAAAADRDDWVHDPGRDVEERLREVARRAARGDARTLNAIGQVAGWLGVGCGILVNVLDPDVLVLGGYFADLAEWVAEPLRTELRRQAVVADEDGCRLDFSTMGHTASLRGAARTVLDRVFTDPTTVRVGGSADAPVA